MPVRKTLKQRPGERNRFLENRPPLPKDKFKLKKKKPRIGEGLAGVKRKVKAKSAEELYDSKRKSFRGSKVEELRRGGRVTKPKEKSYDSKRKSFRKSKIDEFSVGGIAKAAKTLINKYKPKIKNQKEDYGLYSKQDYSGIIKEAEKTQRKKRRNRAGAVVGGAAAAAAIQSKKDKENKK